MAESETSSSILSIWLAPEQQFEKVVLWPTPKAGSGDREMISKISKMSGRVLGWALLGGFWAVAPNNIKQQHLQLRG